MADSNYIWTALLKCIVTPMVLISIVLVFDSFSIVPDNSLIYWSKNRKISWDDFTVKADMQNSALSCVAYREEISYHAMDRSHMDSIIVEATANFDKRCSYVKPDSKTSYLLVHEQGHFDIAEINARRFRKALKEYVPKRYDYSTMKGDISAIDNKILNEWNTDNTLYDKETNRSENKVEQKKWNEKIAKELKELEGYSDASTIKIITP